MPSDSIGLSVVIPAYNEARRLPTSLVRILDHLGRRAGPFEVIVVDDGSTDATAEVAGRLLAPLGERARVLRNGVNRGKGASVRVGMLAARGEHVLFTDADLSTPIEEIEKLERALAAGAKVAIGSRAVDRRLVEKHQPLAREAMGRLFNLVVRLFAVRGIRDTQCGFKLFTRDTARAIFTRTRLDRFGFDVEALALARWLGAPIAEVPVRWCNDEDSRVTLLGGAAAFLDPVRVRLLMLMRRYGSRSTADAAAMPSGFRRGEAP